MRNGRSLLLLIVCLLLVQTGALLHAVGHLSPDEQHPATQLGQHCTHCVAAHAVDLPLLATPTLPLLKAAAQVRSFFAAVWHHLPPGFFRYSRGPPFP